MERRSVRYLESRWWTLEIIVSHIFNIDLLGTKIEGDFEGKNDYYVRMITI